MTTMIVVGLHRYSSRSNPGWDSVLGRPRVPVASGVRCDMRAFWYSLYRTVENFNQKIQRMVTFGTSWCDSIVNIQCKSNDPSPQSILWRMDYSH